MTGSERINNARADLEEALLLAREHLGNKAVLARLYHAMMNSLFALFGIQDIGKLTHADIIEQFEEEYVKTGEIDGAILNALRRAYQLTHECDCEHMHVPTDDDVDQTRRVAKDLLQRIGTLLNAEVIEHEGSTI